METKTEDTLPQVEVRLVDPKEHYSRKRFEDMKDIADFLACSMDSTTEKCCMVCLTFGGHLINYSIVAMGDETRVRVPVRKILQTALLSGADLVVLAHNHPGLRDPSPSRADDAVAYRIYTALDDCGVTLFDCLVTNSGGAVYSYKQEQRGPFGKQADWNTEIVPRPGGLIRA